MALSETEIQTRLTAIRKARDSGVSMVKHGDTETRWRSLSEVNQIIADLEGQLATAQGRKRTKIRYVRQCSKGL